MIAGGGRYHVKSYKGYTATVRFDPDAEVLHGEVTGVRDIITCQATSVEGLREA